MKQHLAAIMVATGLLVPLTAAAWERPVVQPFNLPDESFIEDVTPDGSKAVFVAPTGTTTSRTYMLDVKSGEVIDLPVTHVVDGDDEYEHLGFSPVRTTSISEDGNVIGGAYEGDPAVYYDKKWHKLPFPNRRKSDEFAGFEGEVRRIRCGGKYKLGYAYDSAFDIKPCMWIDDELVHLENLPTADWFGFRVGVEGEANMQFCDMSSDGKWLLGGLSLNHPGWGCSYFLYNMETSEWFIIGEDVLKGMMRDGICDDGTELDGASRPVFSPDGTKLAGVALLVKPNGTPYPDDTYVPFVLDLKTMDFKLYDELAADQNRGIAGVTNDGNLYGWDSLSSIARSVVFRTNDQWYDLEGILTQEYDTDFVALTGLDSKSGLPFYLSEDGRRMVAMGPAARSEGYYIELPDRSFFEAAENINLMKPWGVTPAPGADIARLDAVYLQFQNACKPVSDFDITLSAEGEEPVKATGVEAYNAGRTIWTVKFPSTALADGKKYKVNVPAGTFVMDESTMANVDIEFAYDGREEKPLEMMATIPAEGSRLVSIDASNMVAMVFDYAPVVVNGAAAQLYQKGSDRLLDSMVITASGNTLYAYPLNGYNLEEGFEYEVVLPAGSVTDMTGYCPNDEIRISYQGAWVFQAGDFETIFDLDFNDMATSLSTMKLMYEGDHRTPTTTMQEWGFDTDNTPWNFSVRDDASTEDRVAASHSMYNPSGKSDDWMVTPQLKIDSDNITLEFDLQGYRLDKEDWLKVLVWPSDQKINWLTDDVIESMRSEGTVVFHEVADPGLTADKLEGEWSHVSIPMDDFIGKNVYIAFINENDNQSALFIDNLKVRRNGLFAVGSRTPATVAGVESVPVQAYTMLTEGSSERYSHIKATLSAGEGVISSYEADATITAENPHHFTFPQELPLTLGVYNPYDVEVTLSDGDKSVTSRYSGQVGALTFEPVKRVVLEEGTGTWCGNCPRGMIAIEKIEQILPENFIPVSIHNDDAFAYPQYEQGFLGFMAYPQGRVNRRAEMLMPTWSNDLGLCELASPTGDQTFYDYVLQELAEPTVVGIEIGNAVYDGGKINVDANVEFALDTDRLAYNIFTVVLEDGLQGRQTNYANGSSDPFYGEWATAGAHTMTTYKDVARGIAGFNFNGESGYIPSTVKSSETYTANISMDVPSSVSKQENMKVVCMIIDMNNEGRVVNAAVKEISDGSGVDGIAADGTAVSFTLADGKILANGSDDVEVYNMQGQRMANSGLGAGLYVARAQGAVAKILVK